MTRPRTHNITDQAADAAIDQACRMLRLPTICGRFTEVAELAEREETASIAIASNESFSKAHMFGRTCVRSRRIYAGCAWERKVRTSATRSVNCCPPSTQVVTDAFQESCLETQG